MSLTRKIYVYLKKKEENSSISDLLDIVSKKYQYEIYTDLLRDYIVYNQIKQNILNDNGMLIISSLSDIGDSKTEILSELLWIKQNHIPLVVADYPATHHFDNETLNMLALDVLIDVYKSLQENKSFDIGSSANAIGRKKIKFPDNWATLYNQWQNGDITAKQFMESTGLKKGTFYHLVNDYKELLEMNKDNNSKIG